MATEPAAPRRRFRRLISSPAAITVAGLLAAAGPARAQRVTFTGEADPEIDRRIQGVLGGSYRLLARDTVIPRQDTLRGPVLAVGITLRLEGTVVGDLIGVSSDLFIHPHAAVTGEAVNGGGGLYASALASLGGSVDRPLAQYVITRTADSVAIRGQVPGRSPIVWDPPLHGLQFPQYDRVDGLWLQAGASLRLPRVPEVDSSFLHGVVGWRSGGPGPAVTHTIDLQLRRGHYAALLGEQRLTATSDRWIQGDLPNAAAFLLVANDYRDYYDAQRLFAVLARDWDSGRWGGHVALRGGRETDRSMRTRDTWTLFNRHDIRPNPGIQEGEIASLTAETAAGWAGASSAFALGGEIESAGKVMGGDMSFNRYTTWGVASIQALWGHTLAVQWHVQGPLPGTDSLPVQRWSHVGGPATLPTFAIDRFPGDRVAFVSEQYVIPLPAALSLPLLGPPSLALIHAAGMGWTHGQSRRLEQNLGAELRAIGLAVQVMVNPSHPRRDATFGAGFSFGLGKTPPAHPYFDTRAAER